MFNTIDNNENTILFQEPSINSNYLNPLSIIPETLIDNENNKGSRLYIPILIHKELGNILKIHQPDFKFKEEHFYLILHLIGDLPNSNKKIRSQDNNGFIPLSSTLLQSNLKIREYNLYLDYLIDYNILQTDNHYIPNFKCKGYKYNPSLNSFLISYSCYDKKVNKSLENFRIENKKIAQIQYPYLCKWFNDDLHIDYNKAFSQVKRAFDENKEEFPSLMLEYKNKLSLYKLQLQNEINNPKHMFYELKRFSKKHKPHNPLDIYNSRFRTIERFRLKQWCYVVDETAGRFHSNITGLPKILRNCITYKGQKLRSYDIKNAQVFLSIVFLKKELFIKHGVLGKISKYNKNYRKEWDNVMNNKKDISTIMLVKQIEENENSPDVQQYIELALNGNIYTFFGEKLVGENLEKFSEQEIRAIGKQELIECLFRSNTAINFKESSRVFKELFPNVYSIFKEIKKGRKSNEDTNDKPHKALSCTLQSIEAELVLDKICKEYSDIYPEDYISTVHDCIITTEEMIEEIKPIIIRHLTEYVGYKPKVDLEYW